MYNFLKKYAIYIQIVIAFLAVTNLVFTPQPVKAVIAMVLAITAVSCCVYFSDKQRNEFNQSRKP